MWSAPVGILVNPIRLLIGNLRARWLEWQIRRDVRQQLRVDEAWLRRQQRAETDE
jgi:hypothetical protein